MSLLFSIERARKSTLLLLLYTINPGYFSGFSADDQKLLR